MSKKKIKIGILLESLEHLHHWQKDLFEKIIESDKFEIAAVILDGRPPKTIKHKIIEKIKARKLLASCLFALINHSEQKIFSKKGTGEFPLLENMFKTVKKIIVEPTKKRFVDFFSPEDSEQIKALGVDVLLRHGFAIIQGNILTAAKFGIWSFHHGDNAINRGGPAGFWEVYQREEVTGVTLQILTPELDGGNIIAKGFYNPLFNATQNKDFILFQSQHILLKALNYLYEHGYVETQESLVYSQQLLKNPNLKQTLKYGCQITAKLMQKVALELMQRTGLIRKNCWHLFVGKGSIRKASLWRSVEIKPLKNQFWADPFLFEHMGEMYVFFENYDYKTKVGKISVGKLTETGFEFIGDVLELEHHLSFPYIFKHEDKIYLIPESIDSNQIKIWTAVDFPLKWELSKTLLPGIGSGDNCIFEHDDQWWLFTNHPHPETKDACSELYIYAIDWPNCNEIKPHKMNPVVIDSRVARNAGRPFVENGILYRPSQYNAFGRYGYGLNIMKIKKLTLDEYEEELDCRIKPSFKSGLFACHHVDQVGGYYIIDGCKHAFNFHPM